jgi:hypothetical protein
VQVAKKGYKLHVRASNRRFLRLLKSEVNKMAEFFPGMPQLRAIDHDQETAGVMEPAEVLILSSKGTFRPGSQVHIVGCPIVNVDPDLFLDSKTRVEFKVPPPNSITYLHSSFLVSVMSSLASLSSLSSLSSLASLASLAVPHVNS